MLRRTAAWSAGSVLAVNSAGPRTLPFPGFRREVDIVDLQGKCGLGNHHPLLVPVQQPGGPGDLYLVNGDTLPASGVAVWR